MTNLTPKELEEKIKKVQDDIKELQNQAVSGRKLEVLGEYQTYLEEQLKDLNNKS